MSTVHPVIKTMSFQAVQLSRILSFLHLMTEADPASETPYNINIHKKMNEVQYSNFIMKNIITDLINAFARQRLDKDPAIYAPNNRTGLCNPFLGNGSVNTFRV
jgi:hypothetical protein